MAAATQDDRFALVLGSLVAIAGTAALAGRSRHGVGMVPGPRQRARRLQPEHGRHADRSLATCDVATELPAVRLLHGGSAILSLAVLADSGLEHYRGRYRNPAMFIPPVASGLTLAAALHGARDRGGRPSPHRDAIHATAALAGVIGTGFHVYNVGKRIGGFSLANLFFGAPLGAPMALFLAAALGGAADRLRAEPRGAPPRLLGLPAGRALAALTSAGLFGTVGEVGLLHFRGAYHNPFMVLPVTLPPVAAGLMAAAAVDPRPRRHPLARAWLRLTALLGLAGVGFHAYGVARNMGGWRAWSQSVLSGPPIPAPPSFTGLALAGLAALGLIERRSHG